MGLGVGFEGFRGLGLWKVLVKKSQSASGLDWYCPLSFFAARRNVLVSWQVRISGYRGIEVSGLISVWGRVEFVVTTIATTVSPHP